MDRSINTFLQGSNFNGGTTAQFFNLQGMSVISGYFPVIPPDYTNSESHQNSNQSVIINEHTNRPVILPVGSCILAISIGIPYDETISSSTGEINSIIGYIQLPTYNSTLNVWEPPDSTGSGIYILPFTLTQLQTGTSACPYSNTVPAYCSLAAFMGNNYSTITPPDAIIRVRLLIINPTLAQ
jgi:hypothetical protein